MLDKINSRDVKITVVGMGYIGLPTSIAFAKAGFKIHGFDINEDVIKTLKSGKIHIVEPDLQEAFEEVFKSGMFIPASTLEKSDVFIICVPTPFKKNHEEKIADLSYVEAASQIVAEKIERGNLVILESTVPPKTTDDVMGKILSKKTGLRVNEDFYTAHCPERVLPGRILYELQHNDRIVGANNEYARKITKSLYDQILNGGHIYTTDSTTAEMCKLVENTFRDVNIAFANELSVICDKLGIDVFDLIELANKHPRVNILKPGAGVGGHCLAVDPWFIVEQFPEDANVIRASRIINDFKPHWVVDKVEKEIAEKIGNKKDLKVGVLGLSYKPDIDDLRESPSLEIALEMREKGYSVIACEPYVDRDEIKGIKNLHFDEIIDEVDYLILAVPHRQFKENIEKLRGKKIFDCVGLIR